MKSIIGLFSIVVLLLLHTTTLHAQDYVKFTIKNAGISVDGSFKTFKNTIRYDKNNPANSSFATEIQAKSVNTGMNMRDDHLRKPDFFDIAQFSSIKFVSTSVASAGAGILKVSGNLTIKNVTKPIVLTVKVTEANGKTTFTSSVSINRLTYHVGESSWTMADDLTISLKAVY